MKKSLEKTAYERQRTRPLVIYRVAQGLSQRELGDLADICQETISRIERGHHRPNRKTTRALSAALGVTPDALFPPEETEASGGG